MSNRVLLHDTQTHYAIQREPINSGKRIDLSTSRIQISKHLDLGHLDLEARIWIPIWT